MVEFVNNWNVTKKNNFFFFFLQKLKNSQILLCMKAYEVGIVFCLNSETYKLALSVLTKHHYATVNVGITVEPY